MCVLVLSGERDELAALCVLVLSRERDELTALVDVEQRQRFRSATSSLSSPLSSAEQQESATTTAQQSDSSRYSAAEVRGGGVWCVVCGVWCGVV